MNVGMWNPRMSTPPPVVSNVIGSVRSTPESRGDSNRLMPAPPPVNSSNFLMIAGVAIATANVARAR